MKVLKAELTPKDKRIVNNELERSSDRHKRISTKLSSLSP